MSEFDIEVFIQHMENVENNNFNKVYLSMKEELPKSLQNDSQTRESGYILKPLNERMEGCYHCTNCQNELFYHDSINKSCSKCKQKIDDDIYRILKQNMTNYERLENETETAIKQTIQQSLTKTFSDAIINIIKEYVKMSYVKYHKISFDSDRFKENGCYIGDKKAINIELKTNKNAYKLGDILEIDAYGHHFIGIDDKNELKIIPNPSYQQYNRFMTRLLSVPFEISDEMPDVVRFYRLNYINLFKANGCNKSIIYPVSIVSLSSNHYYLTHLFSLSNDNNFKIDESFKFYLESRNFNHVDTLHIDTNISGLSLKSFSLNLNDTASILQIKRKLQYLQKQSRITRTFMILCDEEFKNIKMFQEAIDTVPWKKLSWKILECISFHNSLKQRLWKVSVSGLDCDPIDVHMDNHHLIHGLDIKACTFMMIFYSKHLLVIDDEFKDWINDIEGNENFHRINHKSNASCSILYVCLPIETFETYPVSDESVTHFGNKYYDDLVIKFSHFEIDPSFRDQMLALTD